MKSRLMEVFVLCCALALKANAQTPVILSQPQDITVNNASTATFTVVATNAATYQWQFGGGNIAGATNSSLTYDDVTTNQAGFYSVVVTSSGGASTNSQPAQLTIVPGTVVQITFSGYADGSSSNVTVQLFDHDKPATVANFLHYITPIVDPGVATNLAFTNMIWDRCVPGFVLQGGDYDAADRTNTTPPGQLNSVPRKFSDNLNYLPPFPFSIDNEFDVGPLIHNKFGTMAMAKSAGNPDSAESGFFFNLADNSSNLDSQNGGFTVFGRVTSGSNVLQYFNTLSKPNEGIFDTTTVSTNQALTDLPVNEDSRNVPCNTNLFFADFQVLTALSLDTNPPTVQVNYPADGQTVTNVDVVLQGTAHDDVSLARVVCNIGDNGNEASVTAVGTTNWTADLGTLAPGNNYTYDVVSQDGAGNLATNRITGSFVVPRYPFQSSVTGNGSLSTNLNGTNTTVGANYTITAKPGKGAVFVNWVSGASASLNPTQNFTMQNGLQMQANFISNTQPHGISITYPANGAGLTNRSFSIAGKVAANVGSAQITCQIFSASTDLSVSAPMIINATNTWSTPVLSLAPGAYIVQAVAQDAGGGATLIAQKFAVLAQLTVITYGLGSVNIPSGAWLSVGTGYTISATPAAGQSFLSWNAGGGGFPLSAVPFTMSDGLTLTVTFVSNSVPKGITFTAPAANAQVTRPNVTLGGKIASSLQAPQVVCQLFQNYVPLTGFMPATVTATNWSLLVTNLTMGTYKAVAMATDASGKTTLASDSFTLNFYPSIAGTYHGLFFDPTNVTALNAGSTTFTLNGSGVVSGNLMFPLASYPFHFQMGATGAGAVQLNGSLGPLNLTNLIFDVTNLSGQMTGYVTQASGSVPLTAYRAVTKLSTGTTPSPGKYVLSLEPVTPTNGILDGPLGDSYAAVNVSAGGNLAVAGTLADNTPFSLSTGVFTNGVWPLYASLFKGKGMLIGWETNQPTGACTGELFWIKSPTNGIYYPAGVQEDLNSIGAKYVPPTPGAQYQIVFGGGTLGSLVTNVFSFNAAGTIVPAAGATDKLTGSLLSTGVLSKGSILNPMNSQILKFSGALVSPSQGGGGFTLDTGTQTGYFEINLAP
jgi:cyclophilin family peptidyl-prolyl cis-trans isomerase